MRLLDLLYIPLALATAPMWAFKKRAGWGERFGKGQELPCPTPEKPRILLHAVSVGEVSALRGVVPLLVPLADVVISVTTDTGIARARELFGATCAIVRYPLDFSWAVDRFLRRVRPNAVALVELEVWPNFVDACAAHGIPTCIINGRLSERSFKGYRRIRGFLAKRLNSLAFAAVQDDDYARRFRDLGMDAAKVRVTGSMKWDAASITDTVPGSDDLARELGIDRAEPLIVAGSTAEDEEAMLHAACPPGVQLLCAPRKPAHFEEAAAALPGCVRRSFQTAGRPTGDPSSGRFLLDTIGELRKAYALADVVVVGRSFGSLYGSDPIEPVALGKATIIGPSVADFRAIVADFVSAGGLVQVPREDVSRTLVALVADAVRRGQLAAAGRACIRTRQGASAHHADLVMDLARRNATRTS
ncbi:MAG TPA: glycosyltransferase N-terminal domain-containing protein [Phycisphaerales bacterium]|nr:glycosyltransferase N-terminal domain-containing protein [Phycisphaerales bacterium]